MKIQEGFHLAIMLSTFWIISGCLPSTEASITVSPTIPILEIPTETPIIIAITEPPPLTPTVIPTLSPINASERMLDLLSNNGNCTLPCVWGITPGQSNYLEARNILIPLSGIAETAYFDYTPYPTDDVSPLYVEGDMRLNTRMAYWYGDNNIVNFMAFRIIEERVITDSNGNWVSKQPIFDSEAFPNRIQYYSLTHVLSEQGIPVSVLIYIPRVEGQPPVAGLMEVVLLYPEQGIWVKYTMHMYIDGNIIRGCPANAHIEMVLMPPGSPDNFYNILDKTDWHQTKGGFKPIEDATSMSIDEFFQTFRISSQKCIETPTNLWSPK